jgi:hypothetical protein
MVGVATVSPWRADWNEVKDCVVVEFADVDAVRDVDDDSMFVVPVGCANIPASARS